eukprot:5059200-Pyramimonas_sp.AAC.1
MRDACQRGDGGGRRRQASGGGGCRRRGRVNEEEEEGELEANGFVGCGRVVTHVPGGPAGFDHHRPPSKRFYMLCVLAQPHLFSNGCVQFKSNGPQAYFKALLKDPTTVPGLSAIKYIENDGESHDGPAPSQLLELPTRSATSEAVAR